MIAKLSSLVGALLIAATVHAAETTARPNILFILIDDLRWDALSCTGHPFIKTPNIDRIAKEGATFRNAFVTTPLCFPSRASFLTGQYAHTHGIRFGEDRTRLGHQLVTFPLLLQQSGYRTAFLGKWHLGNDSIPPPGIDRWVSFKEQGEYVNPTLYIDQTVKKTEGYLTDILTDEAVAFIAQKDARPFLVYLSHKAVHAPFIPAERHKNLFAEMPIVRAPSAKDTLEGKPVLRRPGIVLSPNDPDVHSSDEMIRNQLRCLIAVDEGLKRIFETLGTTGQLENTIIIFTSDHGYFWGEHDLGGKHGPYDEAIRIPLLIRYPQVVKAGSTVHDFALSIDLAPTLLEIAGHYPPEKMEGRSLLPLLKGDASGARTSFLTEFFLGNGTNRFPTWQAVRNAHWKYIRYPEMETSNELYDLQSDPYEMTNLIHDPSAGQTLGEMKAELQRLLEDP